jgi:hypothetical protein
MDVEHASFPAAPRLARPDDRASGAGRTDGAAEIAFQDLPLKEGSIGSGQSGASRRSFSVTHLAPPSDMGRADSSIDKGEPE